jgi:putative hydrolase of the HAD superfamily
MSAISVVVFDLDDTLYPEVEYIRSGYLATAEYLTGPGYDKKKVFRMLWEAFERGPRDRVFNTALELMGLGASESQIAAMVGVYRSHRPNIRLDEATRQVLAELRKEYKLGLITDGYLPAQRYKVAALRLETILDPIVYTEELGRQYWKPSPRAFELMATTIGCDYSECAYVADNIRKDFIAPNQLGWLTIQLIHPDRIHGDDPPPPDGKPHRVIDNIRKLPAALKA